MGGSSDGACALLDPAWDDLDGFELLPYEAGA